MTLAFNTKFAALIFLVFFFSSKTFGQDKTAIGTSVMYNFPLKTLGVGVRGSIPLAEKLQIVPQIKYSLPNKIHEIYAGANLHYTVLESSHKLGAHRNQAMPSKPNLYLAAGLLYNHWFNFVQTQNAKSKQNNILPEIGLGSQMGTKSIRFFAEIKYNIRWIESYGEIGLMVYPSNFGKNKKIFCP